MTTLDNMIIKSFFKTLLVSIIFFVFILELVDLFSNLWRYLNNNASLLSILHIIFLYIPKCIIYSIPIALLFSVAFTLGTYYSENELIAVFGSGISLFRFTSPLIIIGFILSLFSFYFNDNIVIDTYKEKVKLSNILLGRTESYSNTNVTVISKESIIYDADYYNDSSKTLSGLTVIIRDFNGNLIRRLECQWAVFKNNKWEMHKARVFQINKKEYTISEEFHPVYIEAGVNENPDTFKRKIKDMSELKVKEAREWLRSVKKAGLPVYRQSLTDYYERFSFTLTPFIVVLLSSVIGGRFKKNVLLMSLLSSLGISVVYYVIEMILVLLAKQGHIQPITGAWGTFFIFTITGFYLFRKART